MLQVAKQGSMAEQQLHQQQLKALHEDLEALQVSLTFALILHMPRLASMLQ